MCLLCSQFQVGWRRRRRRRRRRRKWPSHRTWASQGKKLPLWIGHLFELLNSLGKLAAEHFFGPFCNSKNELIGSMEPLCQNCKILEASKLHHEKGHPFVFLGNFDISSLSTSFGPFFEFWFWPHPYSSSPDTHKSKSTEEMTMNPSYQHIGGSFEVGKSKIQGGVKKVTDTSLPSFKFF